jgi:hypothetical protein
MKRAPLALFFVSGIFASLALKDGAKPIKKGALCVKRAVFPCSQGCLCPYHRISSPPPNHQKNVWRVSRFQRPFCRRLSPESTGFMPVAIFLFSRSMSMKKMYALMICMTVCGAALFAQTANQADIVILLKNTPIAFFTMSTDCELKFD